MDACCLGASEAFAAGEASAASRAFTQGGAFASAESPGSGKPVTAMAVAAFRVTAVAVGSGGSNSSGS